MASLLDLGVVSHQFDNPPPRNVSRSADLTVHGAVRSKE